MDRPAFSLPGMCQITQLFPRSKSVITLGHKVKEPLMEPSSELSYRLEPHGMFLLAAAPTMHVNGGTEAWEVYPGWCGTGGCRRGSIPGTQPRSTLRLI